MVSRHGFNSPVELLPKAFMLVLPIVFWLSATEFCETVCILS